MVSDILYETNNYQTDIWFGEKEYDAFDVVSKCAKYISVVWNKKGEK